MSHLHAQSTMSELLQAFPGAQRALFAKYHIGGCSSCGFSPGETIGQVCERNEGIDVAEFITHVESSHQADAKIQISAQELAALRTANAGLKILDARTREEHEAVAIPGAQLITQDMINHIFDNWDKTETVVIYDHMGTRSLDAATYFIGHGFAEAKSLSGGINAYSTEVDPTLPRYFVEIE
jgi:rhodanese-related sulfurtransferase